MSNIGDLGKPIGGGGMTGTHRPDPTEFSEAGEHGRGVGISGGASAPNPGNSQSGGNSAFNAGLGGDHASAGIPKSGEHPIADKFMGQDSVSGAYKGGSTGDALTGQSHASTTSGGAASGLGAGAAGAGAAGLAAGAVGGAYAGGSADDGLTGQSSAKTTGAGVGPLAENTSDQARAAAFGTTAGGAASAAGPAATQSGVGPAGGAGGHPGAGAGALGAGAAGAGAAGAGAAAASKSSGQPASDSPLVKDGQAVGHYGTADSDPTRGKPEPISDPKSLDTGGPYSLVFDEKSGKYLHRHELEGQK